MPDLLRPLSLRKPIVNRKLIAWAFVITGIFSVVLWLVGQKTFGFWSIFKPTTVTFEIKPQKLPVIPADTSKADALLVSKLQDQLDKLDGTFSVYIYRSQTNVGYGIAADKVMPAASIMKVPIMIAVLKRIEAGVMTLADVPTGTDVTVENMLEQMGQKSDNSVPVILTNLIGAEYIQNTINNLGMTNTNFVQNTTTALDLNQMWRSLYIGHYLNANSLNRLEQNLSNSIFEDRIPAGLPKNTKVVHKVGSSEYVWSDTAVINSKIYLTILTDGVSLGQVSLAFPELVKTIWSYESLQ